MDIEFKNIKLRMAQDLNKRVLEQVGFKLMKENGVGVYTNPSFDEIAAYLNKLAKEKKIKHYVLKGEFNEVYLFCNDEVLLDFEIYQVEAKKTTEIIKIQCYDQKVNANDDVPLEISKIEELYKIPSTTFNSGTCIYFLCENSKVVYVGQSDNVHIRLGEHHRTKRFDNVYYIRVSANRLNKVEASLIAYLKPIYNISGAKGKLSNEQKSIAEGILQFAFPDL